MKNPLHMKRFCEAGYTLFILMAAIVIIGISLSVGARQWKTIMKQEREKELLFRGDQIRDAIGGYFNKPGALQYPAKLEDLLGDGFAKPRFLRRLYNDPITGGAWELMTHSERIVGVRSGSSDVPLKSGNFPDEYKCFEDAETYQDWVFLYIKNAPNESPCAATVHLKPKTPE